MSPAHSPKQHLHPSVLHAAKEAMRDADGGLTLLTSSSLDNDVLQPLLTSNLLSLQVEDASMTAQPALSLTEYH